MYQLADDEVDLIVEVCDEWLHEQQELIVHLELLQRQATFAPERAEQMSRISATTQNVERMRRALVIWQTRWERPGPGRH